MPPKKKVVDDLVDEADRSLLSVEDFNLPKSMILRLAKGVLPPNTSVQKDALTAILKSTTLFVNYLASNADDRAQLANKKTIRPEDVFGALEEIEFGHFKARVEQELSKYQEIQNNKRNDYRRRVKEDHKPEDGDPAPENDDDTTAALDAASETTRDKSTTPLVVTLGHGDRSRERDHSGLRFGVSRDDTETEEADDDHPPAAKKARTSFRPDAAANGRDVDDNDTLSELDGAEEELDDEEEDDGNEGDDADMEDDDEDVEDDPEEPDEPSGLTDAESEGDGAGALRRQHGVDGMNPNPELDEDSGPD